MNQKDVDLPGFIISISLKLLRDLNKPSFWLQWYVPLFSTYNNNG